MAGRRRTDDLAGGADRGPGGIGVMSGGGGWQHGVETPGWDSFTKLVFDRMHFGVDNNVSALCVLMLASLGGIALVGFGLAGLLRIFRRRRQGERQSKT